MYYPVGWHKVLDLDTKCDQERCDILLVLANHERELFLILTTKSLHIWCPRPAVEIVCHRRSKDSIEKIGLNRTAVWRIDSSVIVVATDRDQLLFYQVRPRITSSSTATSFLGSTDGDCIYKLNHDSRSLSKIFGNQIQQTILSSISKNDFIPALTLFSFGKLDLSSIGVACLMSAEEEMIVGAKNGDIYGVQWNGNVDNSFPWSMPPEVSGNSDHVVDIKFSSILAGFSIAFHSGKAGFMPTVMDVDQNLASPENGYSTTDKKPAKSPPKVNYLAGVSNAVLTEINHRFRLVAYGLSDSSVTICNVGDSTSSLTVNHKLDLSMCKFPHDDCKLGPVKCMRYSSDNYALTTTWEGGHLAIWSVFGSLLFCTQNWQLDSDTSLHHNKPLKFNCVAWGKEGYDLWLNATRDQDFYSDQDSTANGKAESTTDEDRMTASMNSLDLDCQGKNTTSSSNNNNEVLIMSMAHSTLISSPHLTCSSDSVVLMSEDRIYVGPSVPHQDKFDHWITIDIPQTYLGPNYPIKYATIDRECRNLAIAGSKGICLYSIDLKKWSSFTKKSHNESFTVCGDLIWWNEYLVASCFNLIDETFEIRAYLISETLSIDHVVIQHTQMEIIRMSIFESRLLALYSDGTLGMFMLNLRRRHMGSQRQQQQQRSSRSNSITSNSGSLVNGDNDNIAQQSNHTSAATNNNDHHVGPRKSVRSDSIASNWSQFTMGRKSTLFDQFVLQISPIDNLIISNLQANAFCISSIALTRLHFKNNRSDDSILLNSCGKLFLLERQAPPDLSSPSPSSDLSSPDLAKELDSLDSHKLSSDLGEMRVSSTKHKTNSMHLASASLRNQLIEPSASENVTFKAVSVIATNVEQFWISPEISSASEMSYFKQSLWLFCGNSKFQVWLPLLNDKNDPPTGLYVPDRIMLPIRCDIYPLAIRSSAPDVFEPDDAIVLGAESDVLYRDCKLFSQFPFMTVKRQCRVYLHRILRELLLNQHLGYYAKKIAESCQSLPYFAHCFELLLHEVLEEEATSPIPLPDPMLPQVVKFIKEFPVYLETVVHCARKSELSMWSHLFDERAVGNPRKLFQECLDRHKLDTAASCLIILQSLDRNIVSQRMVKELMEAAKKDEQFTYLLKDLENFLSRAELDYSSLSSTSSPTN